MLLFPEVATYFDVYRLTTISAGYSDPVWSGVGRILGRVEPLSQYERSMNNQRFPNVSDQFYTVPESFSMIQPDDCLVADGITRQIRGQPVKYTVFFPRVEALLERVQFTVTS